MTKGIELETKTDVLVVGAGPVGLSMAHFLNKCGIPFRIIEKRTEKIEYSRSFGIHSRTQEIFHQVGVNDKIKEAGRVNCISICAYYQGKLAFQVDLPPSTSSQPKLVSLLQSETERILDEGLEDRQVLVERGMELVDLKFIEDHQVCKSAIVKHLDSGKMEKISFRYIVGCDGARSNVRKMSNIKFTGESVKINLTYMDVNIDTDIPLNRVALFLLNDKEMVYILPINEKRIRVISALNEGDTELNEEELKQKIKRCAAPHRVEFGEVLWKNTFRINECTPETHYKGNVFLCGDSAHIHSPAGGQGMNTGIQDAYNLAWKLSYMVKGIGHEKNLKDSFNEERSKVAKMVLRNSGNLTRNVAAKPNFFSNFVRNYIIPFVLSFKFSQRIASETLSGIRIEYDHGLHIKKIIPGWFRNTTVVGVGKRINDIVLVSVKSNNKTSVHNLLTGGDKFELFIYLPKALLKYKEFKRLKDYLQCMISDPELNKFKDLSTNGTFMTTFISDISSFDTHEFGNYIESNLPKVDKKEIESIVEILNSYPIYLDSKSSFKSEYGVSDYDPTMILVRPDAYVALNQSSTNFKEVVEYFNNVFISEL